MYTVYCVGQSLLSKTNHKRIDIYSNRNTWVCEVVCYFPQGLRKSIALRFIFACSCYEKGGRFREAAQVHRMLREKASPQKMALNLWVGEWLPGYPSMEENISHLGESKKYLGWGYGTVPYGGYVFYPSIPSSFCGSRGKNPCKHRGPPQAASEAMQLFIETGGRKGFAEQSLAVKVKVTWDGWDGSGDAFWAGWFLVGLFVFGCSTT